MVDEERDQACRETKLLFRTAVGKDGEGRAGQEQMIQVQSSEGGCNGSAGMCLRLRDRHFRDLVPIDIIIRLLARATEAAGG